jgi:hypothetical protein
VSPDEGEGQEDGGYGCVPTAIVHIFAFVAKFDFAQKCTNAECANRFTRVV